ncbi:MAG: pantetheine-phosphate adenylyltransferase [Bacteroidales bacterium]
MKKAVFAGSFNPFSIGHYDIAMRALSLFDQLIIAIGVNADKKLGLSPQERKEQVQAIFANDPRIQVEQYEGLTVDFCKKIKATHLVRGVRNEADFAAEQAIANANRHLMPSLDTVILLATPQYDFVSSTIIREIQRNGGNASTLLPPKQL